MAHCQYLRNTDQPILHPMQFPCKKCFCCQQLRLFACAHVVNYVNPCLIFKSNDLSKGPKILLSDYNFILWVLMSVHERCWMLTSGVI